MMLRMIAAVWLMVLGGAIGSLAQSNDAPLRRLLTADEARDWQAVGRVNVQGAGFCTGALIAPDVVLTAAHCLYFPKTGNLVPPDRVHFLAGWRKDWAAAHRKARRIVVHPDYAFEGDNQLDRIASDIALVELEAPIRLPGIRPFERVENPNPGDAVSVVSYARDRSEVPSLQEPCFMLGKQGDVLILSCSANFGASGAPVFLEVDGEVRIASIITSITKWNNQDVSLGVALTEPLEQLMETLDATDPVFDPVRPGDRSLPQTGVEPSGRKVVTPPS